MNLQEIVEENNLKVGDSVLCTWSGDTGLENGEHVIQESPRGRFPVLKGTEDMYWMGNSCKFELIGKKRHVHADLINWWADCPSENFIQFLGGDGQWEDTDIQPCWGTSSEYRKKPTDAELVIEDLFDTSAGITTKYIDDLHCLAKKIHELKGQANNE